MMDLDGVAGDLGLERPMGYISEATFPLPKFGAQLKELPRGLFFFGRGFFVLRGIDVEKYTREALAIIYVAAYPSLNLALGVSVTHVPKGISSYIGSLRGRQSEDGTVLTHIKDLRSLKTEYDYQSYFKAAYTNDGQEFHTDLGDVISLMAIEDAAEGGTSRLCSVGKFYNELAMARPDLVGVLAEEWVLDR